jgi:hypothetical protein
MNTHSNSINGEQRNAEVAAGLRELADWLEQHPELPAFTATIGAYPYGKDARPEMRTVADALGERAIETVNRDRVEIRARVMTRVAVYASTSLESLGADAPAPIYRPIIERERVPS